MFRHGWRFRREQADRPFAPHLCLFRSFHTRPDLGFPKGMTALCLTFGAAGGGFFFFFFGMVSALAGGTVSTGSYFSTSWSPLASSPAASPTDSSLWFSNSGFVDPLQSSSRGSPGLFSGPTVFCASTAGSSWRTERLVLLLGVFTEAAGVHNLRPLLVRLGSSWTGSSSCPPSGAGFSSTVGFTLLGILSVLRSITYKLWKTLPTWVQTVLSCHTSFCFRVSTWDVKQKYALLPPTGETAKVQPAVGVCRDYVWSIQSCTNTKPVKTV